MGAELVVIVNVTERGNPRIIRVELFVHVIAVSMECPFCGARMEHTWQRTEKQPHFDPPMLWCECGKYAYAPSRRE